MERSSASDGGPNLKAGLLAFGILIWAAPALAQDPLAPMPESQKTMAPVIAPAPPPVVIQTQAPPAPVAAPQAPPTPTVVVPRDWRGVFDAIYSGNWSSARAGIAALPPSVLT